MFDDLDKRLNLGLDLHGIGLEELVEEQQKSQDQNLLHEQKHNEQMTKKY
ncbi:unnamed protein product, partial [Rotaria magnacalcarata]